MGGLVAELGKKLAERWVTLLVLPGALYLAVLTTAAMLRYHGTFAVYQLVKQFNGWSKLPILATPGALALLLAGVLLAAAGAGLAAQALGSMTERAWLAETWPTWPQPLRGLAGRRVAARQRRWQKADVAYRQQLGDERTHRAGGQASTHTTDRAATELAHHRLVRIAGQYPARPTWIGDRVHAITTRFDRDYHLDLPTIWPHLWLTMPETTRTEITTARDTFSRAATLAGWGVLYIAVGALWWPGLFLAAAILITAWRRARNAVDSYALLVEAATRLHTTELARTTGLDHPGPLDNTIGWILTCLLQDQPHLITLTTGWPAPPPTPPITEQKGPTG